MRTTPPSATLPGLDLPFPAQPPSGQVREDGPSPRFTLWILSDLRLDTREGVLPLSAPASDAILIAGNVGVGLCQSVRRLAAAFERLRGDRPLVFVPGPLEFCDRIPVGEAIAEASVVALDLGVTLLHDTSVRIGGPRGYGLHILGSVLWPNFSAAGARETRKARLQARNRWAVLDRVRSATGIRFEPHDVAAAHARSAAYLQDALANIAVGAGGFGRGARCLVPNAQPGDKAIVMTAFPPSTRCLPPALARPLLDPICVAWLASDMDADLDAWSAPAAWVHGGTPYGSDFRLGASRMVSNPVDPTRPDNGGNSCRTIVV